MLEDDLVWGELLKLTQLSASLHIFHNLIPIAEECLMKQVEASIVFLPASGSMTPILIILQKEPLMRIGRFLSPQSLQFLMVEKGLHPKIVIHPQGLELLGQGEVSKDHVMDLSGVQPGTHWPLEV